MELQWEGHRFLRSDELASWDFLIKVVLTASMRHERVNRQICRDGLMTRVIKLKATISHSFHIVST